MSLQAAEGTYSVGRKSRRYEVPFIRYGNNDSEIVFSAGVGNDLENPQKETFQYLHETANREGIGVTYIFLPGHGRHPIRRYDHIVHEEQLIGYARRNPERKKRMFAAISLSSYPMARVAEQIKDYISCMAIGCGGTDIRKGLLNMFQRPFKHPELHNSKNGKGFFLDGNVLKPVFGYNDLRGEGYYQIASSLINLMSMQTPFSDMEPDLTGLNVLTISAKGDEIMTIHNSRLLSRRLEEFGANVKTIEFDGTHAFPDKKREFANELVKYFQRF
ncbi:MAG: hypothetical protein JW716_03805 [Candidatus Aenigmarchaeota archaeon]|nr:hypothetical protein [Candidatus Aenigmarchaeota archaeon]